MKKRFLAIILAACLLAALLVLPAGAVAVGDSFTPDMNAWGTQNNNGWYFMYRDTAGAYHEMKYYDSTAAISWQKNNFASDPNADMEMYFISKTEFFVGENGTLPAYAFKAPAMGQIELTMQTHGQNDMHITVYQNSTSVKTFTLNTTGPNAGFTAQSVKINVNAGDMVYAVGSTTGADREAWVHDIAATYLTIGTHPETGEDPDPTEPTPTEPTDPVDPVDPVEPAPGVSYSADMSAWGAQPNNNWYYMYRSTGGQYENLNWYGADASIAWQKNAFAFDPNAMNEMLFINKNSCFTGESGSLPVYAFKCPSGGEVEFSVLTHGQSDMQVTMLKNSETLQSFSLNTTGPEAGFTRTTVKTDVKKGTWLYIVVSTTGADREAWIKDYTVKYLSVNNEEEEEPVQTLYTPAKSDWGTQNNNCWYYMEKGLDNVYTEMNWYDSTAPIDWQKNAFASDPDAAKEMYFIAWQKFFVGELGTKPVYAFLCPSGGQVKLTLITHGPDTINVSVLRNKELIEKFNLSTDGPDAGFTTHEYTIDVKQGTWLYIEGDKTAADREGYISYYAVEYLSFNDEKEEENNDIVGEVFTPDFDKLMQNNDGWYYMYYDKLFQRYEPLTQYGPGAQIEWQRNAFAFDPNLMFEMLFMTNEHYFIGENGSCPVYAFQCPSGGDIRLKVFTHGMPDMYMRVLHNNTQINRYTYNTTGEYNGFTQHIEEFSVKKGDWIYLVCGSTGSDRDGWLSFYGVEYLTANDEKGGFGQPYVYTPNITSDWGKQNNNGWSFQYLDKEDNLFRKLAFVRSDNMFEGTADGGYEYLLVKQLEMHPALKANPAKVFTCEKGGKVQVSFLAWLQAPQLSKTGTAVAVYHNGEKVWPEGEEYFRLGTGQTLQRVTVDAAAGDDIAIVLDAVEENNSFDATNVRVCAQYLGYNDRVRTEWPVYPEEVRPAAPTEPTEPVPTETDAPEETEPAPTESEEPETEKSGKTALPYILGGGGAAVIAAGAAAFVLLKKRRKAK